MPWGSDELVGREWRNALTAWRRTMQAEQVLRGELKVSHEGAVVGNQRVRDRVKVTGLRMTRDRDDPRIPYTDAVLRCDPGRQSEGVERVPLRTPEEREARFQRDLANNHTGLECASCGGILSRKRFERLQGTNPPEFDAVCMGCNAHYKQEALKHAVEMRLQEKSDRRARAQLRKQRARTKAVLSSRAKREQEYQRSKQTKVRQKMERTADVPEAQREVMARELCRRNLTHFVHRFEGLELVEEGDQEILKRIGKGFHIGWFHHFVLSKLQTFLEDVVAGKNPCLMLFTPPRHGKSTMASKLFPAWALGKYPHLEIIAASYGVDLPIEFSRYVRALVQDKAFRVLFPNCRLLPDKQQLKGWGTSKGGQYRPAGVGTGISGHGAHIMIVDDPVKDPDEADSEVIQQRNLAWFLAAAETRLAPHSGKLIIQTRWNENDISGYLERAMNEELAEIDEKFVEEREQIQATVAKADVQRALRESWGRRAHEIANVEQWEIIRFPALATQDEWIDHKGELSYEPPKAGASREYRQRWRHVRKPGDALHPERYNRNYMERRRKKMFRLGGHRFWYALHQQDPTPDAGIHFDKKQFVLEPPLSAWQYASWTLLQAWDLAIGERRQNDWTVGGTAAVDPQGALHFLNVQCFRGGPAEIASAIVAEYETYSDLCAAGVYRVGLEHGQISLAIADSLEHALKETNEERRHARKDELSPLPLAEGEEALVPITDKLVRATPSKGWHRSGRARYPEGAGWLEQLVREHTRFMTGYVRDDHVDMVSWMVRMARRAPLPRVQSQVAPARGGDYGRKGDLRTQLNRALAQQRSSSGYMAA